jgi:hypothetical protein
MEVRMMRDVILTAGLAVITLVGCADNQPNPAGPNSERSVSLDDGDEQDETDRGFLPLVSVVGPGKGHVRATRIPHPTTPGNFAVHIEIRIRHAKPNTGYVGQRAAEAFAPPAVPPTGFDLSTLTDGSCQRGLAIAPWSTLVPPPVAFNTFPDQAHGLPALVITTDGQGNGAADFVVAFGFPLPLFDVMFRVIENTPAPTSVLVSDCTSLPLL